MGFYASLSQKHTDKTDFTDFHGKYFKIYMLITSTY
jgi:hypothetical protein